MVEGYFGINIIRLTEFFQIDWFYKILKNSTQYSLSM